MRILTFGSRLVEVVGALGISIKVIMLMVIGVVALAVPIQQQVLERLLRVCLERFLLPALEVIYLRFRGLIRMLEGYSRRATAGYSLLERINLVFSRHIVLLNLDNVR